MAPPDTDHHRLGATVVGSGARFEVWAPAAATVEIEVNDGVHACAAAECQPGLTTWTVEVDGVGHGDRYRIRLDGGDGLADPASRWQPDGVHGASAVVDESRFAWTDADWRGVALADTVLYELHIGTFTPAGTFDGAIAELGRLRELGVTTLEIMPVAAFPGARNWGYDGVFPFAVQESYGGPEGLARFVDAAHASGLAVVLDVVYNHIGPEGSVLGRFAPFFTDAHRTPWGDAVNVAEAGSDGVRRYFIENAVGWIRDHHLDGLRLDAVHAIVDPTARPFVEQLTTAVHAEADRLGRDVLVTIESSANDPRIVRSAAEHGWGCDAVWDDDVHHALRVALTGEDHEYYQAYRGVPDLAAAWERRWVYTDRYSPTFDRHHGAPADDIERRRFIVFDTNHDHIGNTPGGARMLVDLDALDPRHRLAAAAILLSPFTPMLFMGEEYGERAPFPYFIDHGDPDLVEAVRQGRRREFSGTDWNGEVADPADSETFRRAVLDPTVAAREPHRSRLAMYTELLRMRREHDVITSPDAPQEVSVDGPVLTVTRWGPYATAKICFNFSADPIGREAEGEVVFDTDDHAWGGPGRRRDIIGPWSARFELAP
jgi:maltooligosyltrehalose trehalohydrolase